MLFRIRSSVLTVALGACLVSVAACGDGSTNPITTHLEGVAMSDSPLQGNVSTTDSALPPHEVQTTTAADGTFSVDVTGLMPPFLVNVEWQDGATTRRMFGFATSGGRVELSPISDAAARAVAGVESDDDMEHAEDDGHHRPSGDHIDGAFAQLRLALAPLFALYGMSGTDTASRCGLAALFHDVRFGFSDGVVRVTNRATGAVIYSAPSSALGSGTLHVESFPAGLAPGQCGATTPPGDGTCTSFTYSAFGSCVNGTQTRTVTSSSPAGCTGGSPVLSQACTVTPPTCTSFTYSDFGSCVNGTQTRTVTSSSPAGCTGGAPVLSQACIDGGALYTQYCSGCHGNSKKGKSVAATQGAITADRGGMSSLSFLTQEQLAAISAAP